MANCSSSPRNIATADFAETVHRSHLQRSAVCAAILGLSLCLPIAATACDSDDASPPRGEDDLELREGGLDLIWIAPFEPIPGKSLAFWKRPMENETNGETKILIDTSSGLRIFQTGGSQLRESRRNSPVEGPRLTWRPSSREEHGEHIDDVNRIRAEIARRVEELAGLEKELHRLEESRRTPNRQSRRARQQPDRDLDELEEFLREQEREVVDGTGRVRRFIIRDSRDDLGERRHRERDRGSHQIRRDVRIEIDRRHRDDEHERHDHDDDRHHHDDEREHRHHDDPHENDGLEELHRALAEIEEVREHLRRELEERERREPHHEEERHHEDEQRQRLFEQEEENFEFERADRPRRELREEMEEALEEFASHFTEEIEKELSRVFEEMSKAMGEAWGEVEEIQKFMEQIPQFHEEFPHSEQEHQRHRDHVGADERDHLSLEIERRDHAIRHLETENRNLRQRLSDLEKRLEKALSPR